jgi:putative transposase
VSAKYEFIDAQKAHYPIVKMCQWAQVSRSGYYEWRDRPASATARRREQLKRLVAAVFAVSDGTYGYRRIHAQLVRQGDGCSPELVRALMRELDLHPCQPRPWRPTTTLPGGTASPPDLLGRDFTADTPGTKLVGDITYINTWWRASLIPDNGPNKVRPRMEDGKCQNGARNSPLSLRMRR